MSVASGNAEVGDTLPVRIRSPPPPMRMDHAMQQEGGSVLLTEQPRGVVTVTKTLRHLREFPSELCFDGTTWAASQVVNNAKAGRVQGPYYENSIIRGVAQPGSVLVSVTRGRRFEPDLPDQISHGVLEAVDNVAVKPMRDGIMISWFTAKTDGTDEPDRSAYKGSIPFVMRNHFMCGHSSVG